MPRNSSPQSSVLKTPQGANAVTTMPIATVRPATSTTVVKDRFALWSQRRDEVNARKRAFAAHVERVDAEAAKMTGGIGRHLADRQNQLNHNFEAVMSPYRSEMTEALKDAEDLRKETLDEVDATFQSRHAELDNSMAPRYEKLNARFDRLNRITRAASRLERFHFRMERQYLKDGFQQQIDLKTGRPLMLVPEGHSISGEMRALLKRYAQELQVMNALTEPNVVHTATPMSLADVELNKAYAEFLTFFRETFKTLPATDGRTLWDDVRQAVHQKWDDVSREWTALEVQHEERLVGLRTERANGMVAANDAFHAAKDEATRALRDREIEVYARFTDDLESIKGLKASLASREIISSTWRSRRVDELRKQFRV